MMTPEDRLRIRCEALENALTMTIKAACQAEETITAERDQLIAAIRGDSANQRYGKSDVGPAVTMAMEHRLGMKQ